MESKKKDITKTIEHQTSADLLGRVKCPHCGTMFRLNEKERLEIQLTGGETEAQKAKRIARNEARKKAQ